MMMVVREGLAEIFSYAVVAYKYTTRRDFRTLTAAHKELVRRMWKLWFWIHLTRV